MSGTVQLCSFRLGGLFLGIEVERVQEVLRYQQMTDVPRASAVIAGLINLRGQIVTAIDLRRRFGLPPSAREQGPMNVVVRVDGGISSLLVDEIGDVLEITAERLDPPPPTLRSPARDLIRGVHQLEDELLLLLDVEQVLDFDAACAAVGDEPRPERPTTTDTKRSLS